MKKLLIFVLSLFAGSPRAQIANLILNSDLEDVNVCTEYQSPCSPAAWFAVNQNNAAGYIHRTPVPTINGKHYLHMIAASSGSDRRQYWQTKLLCPTVRGEKYKVALKIAAEQVGPNLNDIGVLLTDSFIRASTDTLLSPASFIFFEKARVRKLKYGWFQIETEFIAETNGQVMVIGNFSDKTNSKIIDERNLGPTVSIMVDDIQLWASQRNCSPDLSVKDSLYQVHNRHLKDTVVISNVANTLAFKLLRHDTIIVSDLLFGINSSQLNDTVALNLIGQRIQHADYDTIRIVGFTDSTGSHSYNERLSLRRAQSIASLISASYPIDSSRIVVVGSGISSKYPGPAKNRRVEVIFIGKGGQQ